MTTIVSKLPLVEPFEDSNEVAGVVGADESTDIGASTTVAVEGIATPGDATRDDMVCSFGVDATMGEAGVAEAGGEVTPTGLLLINCNLSCLTSWRPELPDVIVGAA